MNKPARRSFKFDNAFRRRWAVVTLAYVLFIVVVWGTIARQFPNGIEPVWLFWLIIGLSVGLYVVLVVVIEWLNLKRLH